MIITTAPGATKLLGSQAYAGYLNLNSSSAPTNVTTGDYTGTRLFSPNIYGSPTNASGGILDLRGTSHATSGPVRISGNGAAPASSGSSTAGIILRLQNAATGLLDFGMDGSTADSWIQARDSANYASVYKLVLQPYGGSVIVNSTLSSGSMPFQVRTSLATYAGYFRNDTATTNYFLGFDYNGTTIGSVIGNNTTVAFNTSSDRRLKENIKPAEQGLGLLLKIPVATFNFIHDETKRRMMGFVAQDLYNVYPDAVTATDDNGPEITGPSPWGVDASKLMPLAVRAIQELAMRLETLEERT